jgi:hypothetical protein
MQNVASHGLLKSKLAALKNGDALSRRFRSNRAPLYEVANRFVRWELLTARPDGFSVRAVLRSCGAQLPLTLWVALSGYWYPGVEEFSDPGEIFIHVQEWNSKYPGGWDGPVYKSWDQLNAWIEEWLTQKNYL